MRAETLVCCKPKNMHLAGKEALCMLRVRWIRV